MLTHLLIRLLGEIITHVYCYRVKCVDEAGGYDEQQFEAASHKEAAQIAESIAFNWALDDYNEIVPVKYTFNKCTDEAIKQEVWQIIRGCNE